MTITFGDYLIDSGYHDITPEQEREIWAREECKRRGIDPDANCADGGIDAWMIVAQEVAGCETCGQPTTWQHDHQPDQSGLDDGPSLPGKAPRQKRAPKSANEMKRIRADAWATRRQKYGPHGHR
ncbi:MAG: hypothetical protein E5X05_01465 [Mesorhizobium sp.]|nr:MAG: hypothetical protein E5X05_01465 [Mesorhizobium sp.]